jgi:hypothetical protein
MTGIEPLSCRFCSPNNCFNGGQCDSASIIGHSLMATARSLMVAGDSLTAKERSLIGTLSE